MRIHSTSLIAACLFLAPATGSAQEKGNVGLTMGYPSALGVVWHVTDTVALRPELSISKSATDSVTGSVSDSSGWATGVGLSALFYISKEDNLRTYVSPRYTYSRSSSTSTTVIVTPVTTELKSSTSTFAVSFGAQYSLSPRFGVFGEVGLGYSWGTLRASFSGFRTTTDNWSTRTGAGVILYF